MRLSFPHQFMNSTISCSRSIRTLPVQHGKLRTLSQCIGKKKLNYMDVKEAVKLIKPDSNIFVHSFAATPTLLLEHLCKYAESDDKISNLRLNHNLLLGAAPWSDHQKFDGKADYTPIFLSEVPRLFTTFQLPVDVALITVSPPDKHGFCTLGVTVESTYDALRAARLIIAVENNRMPRTFGDTQIHVSHIDALVYDSREIFTKKSIDKYHSDETTIGRLIAEELVDDGSTIQIGIGAIPDVAILAMKNHKKLGLHTGMFGDGVMELMEQNVITNCEKSIDRDKAVTTLVYGSRKLYDFINDNPVFLFKSSAYTNGHSVLVGQHKMVTINSAIEVDITGQCVSESIGSTLYSGVGGMLDFTYGAACSADGLGKPIIALTSTTRRGQSKIVPTIKEGAGVVVTRGHVRYVVTEYGVAQLWGKTIRQRAHDLIAIAHPNHRELLEREAFARLRCMPSRD